MKIKGIFVLMLGFISYLAIYYALNSYEHTESHPSINEVIVNKFDEFANSTQKPEKFKNYLFTLTDDLEKLKGLALTNPGYLEGSTNNSEQSKYAIEWIKHGGFSADEPELSAAVRHFFDPTKASGSRYLSNRGTYWEGIFPNPRTDAIEWALGDSPKSESNIWTWKNAKVNMYLALTEKDSAKRNEAFAWAFRSVGEVLHNTADMGCPPHVRNDSHAAPFGYSGGWILGSPDPYEELYTPAVTNNCKNGEPDESLRSYFSSATTVRSINEKMAQFTNANFFTNETINGVGVDTYKSINKDGGYSAPLLENLEYLPESFKFIKKFPSGREIILARDQSYFRFRGYPYVDKKAAHSQAEELVPNIISAGINVMRLFIPHLQIEMKNVDDLSDTVEIEFKHITDDEYSNPILYAGPVKFLLNNKIQDSVLIVEKGKFKGILPFPVKNGDLVKPFITLPGFTITSEKELKINMDPLWGQWYVREVLDGSNDPAAPKAGTVFDGVKFFTVLKTGMIKITNLDGSGLMQLYHERNGLSFTIYGSNATNSYNQTGNVANDQESWSGQTKSTYKEGSGSNQVEYFRNYTSSGSRKKLSSKQYSNGNHILYNKLSYDLRKE
jgi:hypothetical protein